jgi:hypothetical protein
MNLTTGSLFVLGGLYIFGFAMSLFISYMKCSKISWSISAMEGVYWTFLPTLCYFLASWSPYVRDIFSVPLKGWFSLEEEYSHAVGTAYFMMLGSWISTTRMLHTTESQVCQPDSAELAKFEKDLEAELKEKEDKNNGSSVSADKIAGKDNS